MPHCKMDCRPRRRRQIRPRGEPPASRAADEPPVVARLIVEIRSDGSRTIARGALEDAAARGTRAIEARGDSPLQLAIALARALTQLPRFSARSPCAGSSVVAATSEPPRSRGTQPCTALAACRTSVGPCSSGSFIDDGWEWRDDTLYAPHETMWFTTSAETPNYADFPIACPRPWKTSTRATACGSGQPRLRARHRAARKLRLAGRAVPATPLVAEVQSAHARALILVDLQYDFCPAARSRSRAATRPSRSRQRLMPHFERSSRRRTGTRRTTRASRSTTRAPSPASVIDVDGLPAGDVAGALRAGTRGRRAPDRPRSRRITEMFRKGTDPAIDSYSGFFDNGHKQGDRARRVAARALDRRASTCSASRPTTA